MRKKLRPQAIRLLQLSRTFTYFGFESHIQPLNLLICGGVIQSDRNLMGDRHHQFKIVLLALMKGIRDGSIDAREEALALAESDDADLSDRVWTNVDGCFTNFPPPPGFAGFQQDKWGDDDYYRVLTPDETKQYEAVLADWAAEDAAEVAGRLADDEARRRYFFDIEESEEEDSPEDGPPAGEPTSEPLLLTDATESTSEDPPSENAPTSEDQPSEAPTMEPSPQQPTPDEATGL